MIVNVIIATTSIWSCDTAEGRMSSSLWPIMHAATPICTPERKPKLYAGSTYERWHEYSYISTHAQCSINGAHACSRSCPTTDDDHVSSTFSQCQRITTYSINSTFHGGFPITPVADGIMTAISQCCKLDCMIRDPTRHRKVNWSIDYNNSRTVSSAVWFTDKELWCKRHSFRVLFWYHAW